MGKVDVNGVVAGVVTVVSVELVKHMLKVPGARRNVMRRLLGK
jgi:hypothetical protein